MPEEVLPGVYLLELNGQKRLATRSDTNISVYGEHFVEGYRLWDPNRSKLSALFQKAGIRNWLGTEKILDEKSRVLYLGAATGTTVSHISDIVRHGLVYAVEFSPRAMLDLLRLCEIRDNIVPVLANASKPESYCHLVEQVDLVYQDVAQRNQSEIANLNCDVYLQRRGILILMIKARSIDVVASPREIFNSEIEKLNGLEVLITSDLHPYHHDHLAVVARKI